MTNQADFNLSYTDALLFYKYTLFLHWKFAWYLFNRISVGLIIRYLILILRNFYVLAKLWPLKVNMYSDKVYSDISSNCTIILKYQ